MFARRTEWELRENRLSQAIQRTRATRSIIDLTASNPTDCEFAYAEAEIRSALSDPAALHYEPAPFGLLSAREQIARYYGERRTAVDPQSVLLTTSTSEAYSYIFRLLCDPGDEVLVPRPSYPLFDLLADVCDVKLMPYDLFYDHGWHIDQHTMAQRTSDRTRAIMVVSPNNPTGSYVAHREVEELRQFAAERQLAIVADEVFWDYPLEGAAAPSFAMPQDTALTFTLSGLSKVAALPQIKLAWTVVSGPEQLRREALARLEVIADTFLSVNAPVQHALPRLLATALPMQQQIRARTRANLAELDCQLANDGTCSRLHADAGWYAIVRIPRSGSDEDFAVALLEREGVLVHPGHFFNFVSEGHVVISLLPRADEFAQGIAKVLAAAEAGASGGLQ